ncbi:MAG: hypothetical protein KQH63_19360 [Desulfobulbaceae bacterium]|nr:hypothetical protein [Desulfobulbaceae bacterium]
MLLLTAVAVGFYLFKAGVHPDRSFSDFLILDVHPLIFIGFMLFLPMFGFSIGFFLVLVGMKFGALTGIVVTGFVMLVQIMASYMLGNSYLRPKMVAFLEKRQRSIPTLPDRGKIPVSFIFMVVPGLPYAMKNYLLAFSDLTFFQYVSVSWLAQFGLSIPFIILGKAVIQENFLLLVIAVSALLCGYVLLFRLQRRFAVFKNIFSKDH